VAGYIKVIHVDVGDHVKAGQTLAVLENPRARRATRRRGCWRAAAPKRKFGGRKETSPGTIGARRQPLRLCPVEQAAESRSGLVAQQEIDDSQQRSRFEAQVSSSSAALSAANSSFK